MTGTKTKGVVKRGCGMAGGAGAGGHSKAGMQGCGGRVVGEEEAEEEVVDEEEEMARGGGGGRTAFVRAAVISGAGVGVCVCTRAGQGRAAQRSAGPSRARQAGD